MDFPVSFTDKMKSILGDEFEDFLKKHRCELEIFLKEDKALIDCKG